MTVLRKHQVRLDIIHAQVDGKAVGLEGMLGKVARGCIKRDQITSDHSSVKEPPDAPRRARMPASVSPFVLTTGPAIHNLDIRAVQGIVAPPSKHSRGSMGSPARFFGVHTSSMGDDVRPSARLENK